MSAIRLHRPEAGTGNATDAAKPGERGTVVRVAGSVVGISGLRRARLYDVVLVGPGRLPGEIVRLAGDRAIAQVYETTNGLRAGDPVTSTGGPLSIELGPGLLGSIVDGTARPLAALAGEDGGQCERPFLARGASLPTLDRERRFEFRPAAAPGDVVAPGDRLGFATEAGGFEHSVLVPPGVAGTVTAIRPGAATVTDGVAEIGGRPVAMLQRWPVRRPRPVARRLAATRPLVTGQRVIDTMFPVARGGAATIPGGFGTGKTVLEQQIAKWADAEVVVYVGCGERGNELTEVLEEFPRLTDPQTGASLADRTLLVANTSNMSVAAREASIYAGVTIAEYFRDQGRHVTLLADSTSRWGEALREISGRLGEMPAEDGYPAYLATRLAGFYERAGAAVCLGRDQRRGSVTIVGAVSPAGGDFSEPITQHTLRMAGTFWALDRDLARARHFPAVDWRRSYTLYRLDGWFTSKVAPGWRRQREWALDLLQRETSLLEIVQLLGADTLPPQQQVVLRTGRLLREDFLQQSSFDETDAYCPLDKQHAMLGVIRAAHEAMSAAVSGGVPAADVTGARILGEIARMRGWPPAEAGAHADDLTRRIQAALALEAAPQPDAAPHPEAGPEPEASAEPEAGAGQGGDAR
jgi:V/A-type H+-transporting ATPase subunit A